VLTEGFRQAPTRKVEVVRAATGGDIETPADQLLAVVCDGPVLAEAPRFGFDETVALADLIVKELGAAR